MADEYFNVLAWVLARYAFLMTHVAFFYFLLYATNDPLNLGFINTIDAKPSESCTTFDKDAFTFDLLLLFGVWWGTHSTLARESVKKALGLWNHPLDRPIFAFIASNAWFTTVHFWKPIDTCNRFDIFKLDSWAIGTAVGVFALASFFILSLLYILPAHVFGTQSHKYPPGHYHPHGDILVDYPYGLSRHPAAAGFFYIYSVLFAFHFAGFTTINHVVLAVFWQVFILVGTLVFEEGGLHDKDEFGKKYMEYRNNTGFLCPTMYSLKRTVGAKVEPYSWEKTKSN